ncbi:MAG: hypothetical protein Q9219_002156 [cf. Caloplaca sp. 3 TL-2023]
MLDPPVSACRTQCNRLTMKFLPNLSLTVLMLLTISPNLILSTLSSRLPTLLTLPTTPPHEAILCYDPRYARHQPKTDECISIIGNQLIIPPFFSHPLNFSRRPNSVNAAFRVPHAWRSKYNNCVVEIDIPEVPTSQISYEESSFGDVKAMAVDIIAACVARGHRLGGIGQTGKKLDLQVRVGSGWGASRRGENW